MCRRVSLVVCSRAGKWLGTLPSLDVGTPWWHDVEPVVEIARQRYGIDIVVLRLLDVRGEVTYLAELVGDLPRGLPLGGVEDPRALEDHVLRAPWARPGGIVATVAWADTRLAQLGRPRTGRVVQVKSWNLSSILRLPTAAGDVWCKTVPAFFAHEGAVIEAVGGWDASLVPPLLAADRRAGTILLGDVPGEDQWTATPSRLVAMVRKLVALQASFIRRTPELLTAGLPDWRAESLSGMARDLVGRTEVRAQFSSDEIAALDALAGELPRRLADLTACGLPETLVHGDFHPGNWRADGGALVLLDWSDSGVGHPMLDFASFLPRVADEARGSVRDAWIDAWAARSSQADAARAARLAAPIAAVRCALNYQRFLDGIEPSERRYHEADVAAELRRALAAAR